MWWKGFSGFFNSEVCGQMSALACLCFVFMIAWYYAIIARIK